MRPVIRLKMEVASVYRVILYTDMCGDSGRPRMVFRCVLGCGCRFGAPGGVPTKSTLEVDAATLLLPITVTGRLRPGRTADLQRLHRRRRCKNCGAALLCARWGRRIGRYG